MVSVNTNYHHHPQAHTKLQPHIASHRLHHTSPSAYFHSPHIYIQHTYTFLRNQHTFCTQQLLTEYRTEYSNGKKVIIPNKLSSAFPVSQLPESIKTFSFNQAHARTTAFLTHYLLCCITAYRRAIPISPSFSFHFILILYYTQSDSVVVNLLGFLPQIFIFTPISILLLTQFSVFVILVTSVHCFPVYKLLCADHHKLRKNFFIVRNSTLNV